MSDYSVRAAVEIFGFRLASGSIAWVEAGKPCRPNVPKAEGPRFRFRACLTCCEYHAKRIPDAPAILAPGRAPLTYGRLYQHIDKMGRTLRAMGIGRRDRVAVVLPNGPEMAVAILTVAASAACAPMNPAYGAEELDRYFADLRPRALITQAGINSPARRVALSRGVRVIELSTAPDAEAGLFTLTGDRRTCGVSTSRSAPATWRCCCSRRAPHRGRRSSR